MRQAATGALDGALERLRECGADESLVTLCTECLARARRARPESAAEVAERVSAYLTSVEERARVEGYFPPAIRKKALQVGPQIQGALRRAVEAGVRIAFGTDSGVSPYGENAREFAYMVEAGMSEMEAIAAATVHAAELLGLADEIGTIERRFVGLGPFLDDTNRMRIRLEPGRVSPGQRWGLVVAALLAGVDDEEVSEPASQ